MPDLNENFCHKLIQYWIESLLMNKESKCSGKHEGEECLTFLLQNTSKAETASVLKCSICYKSISTHREDCFLLFSQSWCNNRWITDYKSCIQDKENAAPWGSLKECFKATHLAGLELLWLSRRTNSNVTCQHVTVTSPSLICSYK